MKITLIILSILLLTGCADSMTYEEAMVAEKVGFLHGLWHGFIIFFSWVGSLFYDDIAIYAINNNGNWYDFGFLLGVGGLGFGTGININFK
tara:strand:- start:29314 stop:29586 length:273 start_codon:yes stop_codon:yes gene_type:complete